MIHSGKMTAAKAKPDAAASESALGATAMAEGPRPLIRAVPPAPPFPMEALGDILAPAALAIQDCTQAPVVLCAQGILAASTLAVHGFANVLLPPADRPRPLSNFLITVAESGERKTTCDSLALKPICDHEENLARGQRHEMAVYEQCKAAWDGQRRQIQRDKVNHPTLANKEKALKKLGTPPVPPLVPFLTCPEPTYEGLVKLLQQGQPAIGLFSSEGGQFIGGHGMNEDNRLKTAAGLSALWDGEPVRRVRVGDGIYELRDRRLSMHLMVQPDVATRLLGDDLLRGQGLLSRMLVVEPDSTIGTRKSRKPAAKSEAALAAYYTRMAAILGTPLPVVVGTRNTLAPRPLPLSKEAMAVFVAFADEVEEQLAEGGRYDCVRAFASKAAEHAGRIAGVLALVDNIGVKSVSKARMLAACDLMRFYLDERVRLRAVARTDAKLALAEKARTWLLSRWPENLVSLPDLYQYGPHDIRNAKEARTVARILQEHGWLSNVPGGVMVRGEIRREAWRIIRAG